MPLEEDDLQAISELLNTKLTEQERRFEAQLKAATKDFVKPDDLAGLMKPEPKSEPKPEPEPSSQGQKDPALKKLEDQLAALQRQNDEATKRAEAAEAARRAEMVRTAVRNGLTGVRPEMLDIAVEHLVRAHEFEVTDSGQIAVLVSDNYGGHERVSVQDKVSAFLETDTGKSFLPPVQKKTVPGLFGEFNTTHKAPREPHEADPAQVLFEALQNQGLIG